MRGKRATPKSTIMEYYMYSITCPHCKTELQNSFKKNVTRFLCNYCYKEIIVNWEKFEQDKEEQ